MMRPMKRETAKTRLFVTAPLNDGGAVALERDKARYLGQVLRQQVGDAVVLFNGRDGEWRARIDALSKNNATLVAETQLRDQDAPGDLRLVFAPIKKARLDFLVEKATELGVARLSPVITDHTDVARVNTERLRANALEAAEQCGRLSVPAVDEPVALTAALADWDAGQRLLMMDETGGGIPIAAALSGGNVAPPLAVLIGPEGGFSRVELDALRDLSFVTRIGLGPRILRAETAAVAALSCVQSLCGDWGEAPPARHSR